MTRFRGLSEYEQPGHLDNHDNSPAQRFRDDMGRIYWPDPPAPPPPHEPKLGMGMTAITGPEAWRDRAACKDFTQVVTDEHGEPKILRGNHAWFAIPSTRTLAHPGEVDRRLAVCAECPVRDEGCLDLTLAQSIHSVASGVWAGEYLPGALDPAYRRAMQDAMDRLDARRVRRDAQRRRLQVVAG